MKRKSTNIPEQRLEKILERNIKKEQLKANLLNTFQKDKVFQILQKGSRSSFRKLLLDELIARNIMAVSSKIVDEYVYKIIITKEILFNQGEINESEAKKIDNFIKKGIELNNKAHKAK